MKLWLWLRIIAFVQMVNKYNATVGSLSGSCMCGVCGVRAMGKTASIVIGKSGIQKPVNTNNSNPAWATCVNTYIWLRRWLVSLQLRWEKKNREFYHATVYYCSIVSICRKNDYPRERGKFTVSNTFFVHCKAIQYKWLFFSPLFRSNEL